MKLLDDRELRETVMNLEVTGIKIRNITGGAELVDELMPLFQSQQQAWGEYVIGEDAENIMNRSLQEEQRTRNNKKERE